jgi:hypothetical protein
MQREERSGGAVCAACLGARPRAARGVHAARRPAGPRAAAPRPPAPARPRCRPRPRRAAAHTPGSLGRFGNTLFQLAFAVLLAERHGLRLQVEGRMHGWAAGRAPPARLPQRPSVQA